MARRFGKNSVAFKTLGVLGGAYRGKALEERALLTHLVGLNERGSPNYVGCSQNVDNICPDGYTAEEEAARPTCPICATKYDKLRA